jgi:PAS domain S-box-containing protein
MNSPRSILDARQFTVRTKLALGVTLLLGCISFFIYVYFPGRLEQQAESALVNKAESIADAMAYAVSPALLFDDRETVQGYLNDAGHNEDLVYIVVLDNAGDIFAGIRKDRAGSLVHLASAATIRRARDDAVLSTVSPIRSGSEQVGRLYLGVSTEPLQRQVSESRYMTALISVIIFIAGLLGTFAISTLVTQRLNRIARTVDVISGGDLAKRAPVSGSDEIADLARSFNTMVDQVEAAQSALRRTNLSLEVRVAERTRELKQEATGHKQTAEELRRSEERFRAMFQSAGMGIVLVDRSGTVLSSNPALRHALGCAEEDLHGRVLAEFAHEEDSPSIARLFKELVTGKRERFEAEIRCHRADSSLMWSQLTFSSLPSGDGRPQFAIGMFDDITERKRLERELEEAQKRALLRERDGREQAEQTAEKLSHYPRMNPNPVAEVTRDGKLSYLNESGTKLAEQVGASDPAAILPPGIQNIVQECLDNGEKCSGYETIVDGVTLTWSFYPIVPNDVVYGYGFDISQRLELETQLREAQKLEAVGRLAGGVAHDFNNVLMAITGLSDMLLDELRDGDPMREDLQEIQKAADRAASLTRQLLAFSRRQMLKPVELDLNAVMADMQKMVRRLIGEDVELVTVLESDLWRVEADPGQVEQVLMNLAVNARDAMPQGGKLMIETRNQWNRDERGDTQTGLRALLHHEGIG